VNARQIAAGETRLQKYDVPPRPRAIIQTYHRRARLQRVGNPCDIRAAPARYSSVFIKAKSPRRPERVQKRGPAAATIPAGARDHFPKRLRTHHSCRGLARSCIPSPPNLAQAAAAVVRTSLQGERLLVVSSTPAITHYSHQALSAIDKSHPSMRSPALHNAKLEI